MEFYRKNTIGLIATLTFLDDRPVFELERRLNDAWMKGGREGETRERTIMAVEKEQEKIRRMEARKLAQQRYQARVRAMQARLQRETISENEVFASDENHVLTDFGDATSDQKDAESDSKSETSDSWMQGTISDGESVTSVSGLTEADLEQDFVTDGTSSQTQSVSADTLESTLSSNHFPVPALLSNNSNHVPTETPSILNTLPNVPLVADPDNSDEVGDEHQTTETEMYALD